MFNEKCNDIASDNCATQTFLPSIDFFIPEPCSQLSTSVMNENAAFHSLVEREWLPKPLYYEVAEGVSDSHPNQSNAMCSELH